MNTIVMLDSVGYNCKPTKDIISINKRIANGKTTISLKTFADLVGNKGHSFVPGIFNDSRKSINVYEQQIFALDFDDGNFTFETAFKRAEKYNIPILFAYHTFSSTEDHQKFRMVFVMYEPIKDRKVISFIQNILMEIFKECDSCCSDMARIFFGGKELIYYNNHEETLNPFQLTIALKEEYNLRNNDKTSRNNLRNFYIKNNIAFENGQPLITSYDEEKKCANTIYYYMVNAQVFSNQYISFGILNDNSVIPENKKKNSNKRRSVIRNFSFDNIYRNCRLYRELCDGTEYFYYKQLFGLATNIYNFENGRKHFTSLIYSEANSQDKCPAYYERDWNMIINEIIKRDYAPERCDKFCPYCNECQHDKNMVMTVKQNNHTIKEIEKHEYVSIEQTEKELHNYFHQAIENDDKDIHLIIAQTGIGKSQTYIEYMKNNSSNPLVIAVPTNNLKYEIYHRALEMGITNITTTPVIPILPEEFQSEVDHLYSIGAGNNVKQFLKKNLNKLPKPIQEDVSEYLDKLDSVSKFNGHIITTHEYYLLTSTFLEEGPFPDHTAIIDEDILFKMLMQNTVSYKDIDCVMNHPDISSQLKNHILNLMNRDDNQIYKYNKEHIYVTQENVKIIKNIACTNIINFVNSKCFCFMKDEIVYMNVRKLPKRKTLILSATASPILYEQYFPNVQVHTCSEAKYLGKIIQHTDNTYSRNYFRNNDNAIKETEILSGDNKIITFKFISHLYKNSDKYYFGNLEGIDSMNGQDISVIGLPNSPVEIYNLYGMAFHETPSAMFPQFAEYKGYKFHCMTFKNKILREIQFTIINSNLEQAIGRARLLRNNCTVKVFARFPISQAETVTV